MRKTWKASVIALLWTPLAVLAGGGGGGGVVAGMATEVTQIANNVQLAASYEEQALQTVTQLQQYDTMLRNLQILGPSSLVDSAAQKLWTDHNMLGSFRDLFAIVENGNRLAYSMASIANQLKAMQPPLSGSGRGTFDYAGAYRNWMATSRNTVDAAIRVNTAQADNFASEQQLVRALQSRSASAVGQMEALKAGTEVGLAQVTQLQQLRQLMIAQNQAQATTQKSTEAKQRNADEMLLRYKSQPPAASVFGTPTAIK